MIGASITELDTPALLLDGPLSDGNLRRAAAWVADKPVKLRPHFKNHKCVTLARRQLAMGGCVGITAAKLGEAEALVAGGVRDVLVANQVVGGLKARRLANLLKTGASVRVAVDSLANAAGLAEVMCQQGVTLGVLVEVDIGMGRCGVEPGEPALALVRQLLALPGVRFDGLQAYEGNAVAVMDPAERAPVAIASMNQAIATRRLLEANGIAVAILSGAGAATYRMVGELPGVDELQIGSYATMDWTYHQRVAGEFAIALSVLCTVISVRADAYVLDVGVKAVGDEMGPPKIKNRPTHEVRRFVAEEHCVVHAAGHDLKVGDKVELIPSHCCTTCNLHRTMVVHEGGRVRELWPIEASGALT